MSHNKDNSKAFKIQKQPNQSFMCQLSLLKRIEQAILLASALITIVTGSIQIKDRIAQPQLKSTNVVSTQEQPR